MPRCAPGIRGSSRAPSPSGLERREPGEPVRVVAADGGFVAAGYANPAHADRRPRAHARGRAGRRRARRAASRRGAGAPPRDAARGPHRLPRRERRGRSAARHRRRSLRRLPRVPAPHRGRRAARRRRSSSALQSPARAARHLRAQRGRRARRGGTRRRARRPRRRGAAGAHRIVEDGMRFVVDVLHGQKTGFFLDQRESRRARARARRRAARAERVRLHRRLRDRRRRSAARGRSSPSTPRGRRSRSAERRGGERPDRRRARLVAADVFDFLRGGARPLRSDRARPAAVRAPPPRPRPPGCAATRTSTCRRSAGSRPAAGCSPLLLAAPARDAFRQVVAAAAADAGRPAQVVAEWGHPPDHPVALAHPEGEYLKVLLLRA